MIYSTISEVDHGLLETNIVVYVRIVGVGSE